MSSAKTLTVRVHEEMISAVQNGRWEWVTAGKEPVGTCGGERASSGAGLLFPDRVLSAPDGRCSLIVLQTKNLARARLE